MNRLGIDQLSSSLAFVPVQGMNHTACCRKASQSSLSTDPRPPSPKVRLAAWLLQQAQLVQLWAVATRQLGSPARASQARCRCMRCRMRVVLALQVFRTLASWCPLPASGLPSCGTCGGGSAAGRWAGPASSTSCARAGERCCYARQSWPSLLANDPALTAAWGVLTAACKLPDKSSTSVATVCYYPFAACPALNLILCTRSVAVCPGGVMECIYMEQEQGREVAYLRKRHGFVRWGALCAVQRWREV